MPEKIVSPEKALRMFMDAVFDEAKANPEFRSRLALALGNTIVFEGEADISTVEPVEIAVRHSEDAFKRIYSVLAAPRLRALLTANGLASTTDVRGKAKPALLEMLWVRARDSAEAQGLLREERSN